MNKLKKGQRTCPSVRKGEKMENVIREEQIYEGKAKKVYRTNQQGVYWVEYKDDATAFNGEKRGTIRGKGELNNRISAIFFTMLKENGVENHFIERLSETEQLVRQVKILPLEVVVRNIAAGSLSKRLGLPEGTQMPQPVVEFYYKDDALGDPMINDSHIEAMRLATKEQVEEITRSALRVNEILTRYLAGRKVILVDFKLEYGVTPEGKLLLADEISPDTCRFWDSETMEKLDKDRFRRDLGGVEEAYQEILRRLTGEGEEVQYKVRLFVTLKEGVLDPQGSATEKALNTLGYEGVEQVRVGKYIELLVAAKERGEAEAMVRSMAEKVLSNPVIENFRYELTERNG